MWRLAALILIARAVYSQSVEIALTNAATHTPMPGVALNFNEYTATTDAAGVARIPAVRPGRYNLRIDARGFITPADSRAPIQVRDENLRLDFALMPQGRVRGRVSLPDRRPVAGAKVTLEKQRFFWSSSTTTSADGSFTADAPVGGRFTLAVEPPPNLAAPEGQEWAVTYYPDATSREAAQILPLAPGANLLDYDIRLRSVPIRRVSGIVRDDAGKPAPHADVVFASDGKSRPTRTGDDGAFTIALPAGEWTALPRLKRGDVELLGFERLTVGRRDIDRLELRLAHPFSIPVAVEGVTGVAVSLVPEPARGYFREGARTEPDGSRRFRSVYPGAYTVEPVGFKPCFYLESVKLGEREILGQRVEFVEGVPPIHITFKHGAASLRAHVEKGTASTVVAVPQDEALMALDVLLRNAQPDPAGRCELTDLRPGDYYVFAFDEWDREALKDPLFVGRLLLWAERVHLDENGSANVSLKVTPWPE